MSFFLSPIGNSQTFDANGDPLTGGQIETYLAGSTTPAATYTDDSGGTPQANPIILNSLGWPANPIWLTGGVSYKFVIKDALGSTLRTIDDISGVNDASVSQSEWVNSGLSPTFIGATSFSVPGDQTAILQVNRRLRTTNTSGLIYSSISNSVFAAGITTITVVNDSGSLDGGLTTVEYGLLAATSSSVPAIPVSRFTMATARILGRDTAGTGAVEELTGAESQALLPIQQTRVDVASAATVNLTSSVPSNDHVNITGTTTITAFTVGAGRLFFVRFNASLTLTNNANIVTQTGANIVTQPGDTCILRATAANVVEVLSYVPAALNQQTTRSMVRVSTANGYGSTNTVIRRFTTVLDNVGSDITYTDSATLGASFTINVPGVYSISYNDSFNAAANFGLSLNSNQLTTSILSITAANRISNSTGPANNQSSLVAVTRYFAAADVVRAHTDGTAVGATNVSQITITRVA